jgi:hypothetical protein
LRIIIIIIYSFKNDQFILHSRATKVKSTSVDRDKMNGPSFYGS